MSVTVHNQIHDARCLTMFVPGKYYFFKLLLIKESNLLDLETVFVFLKIGDRQFMSLIYHNFFFLVK